MNSSAEKIKKLRTLKGISQTEVADQCGIKQSSYANIENGKTQNITIEIGKGIAKALEVPFYELFDILPENRELNSQIENLKSENERLNKELIDTVKFLSLYQKLEVNYKTLIINAIQISYNNFVKYNSEQNNSLTMIKDFIKLFSKELINATVINENDIKNIDDKDLLIWLYNIKE
jgi:transcriptional regulator with XRE-family HTH domain